MMRKTDFQIKDHSFLTTLYPQEDRVPFWRENYEADRIRGRTEWKTRAAEIHQLRHLEEKEEEAEEEEKTEKKI